MSIGGSSSDGSPAHSSCGSSVSERESRKRAADESPDREREGSSRRNFPGRVMRSAAGCRVYIPPIADDRDDCPGCIVDEDGTFTARIAVRHAALRKPSDQRRVGKWITSPRERCHIHRVKQHVR